MKSHRPVLLAGLSLASLAFATTGFAQTAAAPEGPEAVVDAVVVTGTRAAPRARLDTVAPVDVINATQISRVGNTELAQALSAALPSLNFTRPAVTDGTDTIRPITLRGMQPDQTLVLINSKRAHASSLVNLNGSVGYGSVSVDVNTIPTAALGSVEVLRDGASAQYGSDAIAGVVNLRLREARSGGNVSVTVGQRDTTVEYNTAGAPAGPPGLNLPAKRHLTDGASTTVSGWVGLPLFDTGFLTVSLESLVRSHTTRAGPDPRQQYANLAGGAFDPREYTIDRFDNWYGDPQMEQLTAYVNAGYDFDNGSRLYAYGGYQQRDAISAANWRRPIQETAANPASNLLAVYPNGFLPKIEGKVDDYTAVGGYKFKLGGWNVDASLNYGENKFAFGVIDSINVSMGPGSPTRFNAGELRYRQGVANLDVSRTLNVSGVTEMNFAAGGEIRREGYKISAGELASYVNGGFRTAGGIIGGVGTQGFPGFAPSDATSVHRTSESAYADLETKVTDAFSVDLAGRYEHYSDFGSIVTGKLAARYDLNPHFALRGAVSRGFRAPSLQQQNVSYTAITFIGGQPVTNAVLRASNPVASLIGAVPLKPEKSMNYSAGGVFRMGAFSLTLDGYIIRINDRIALSDALTQANVIALFPTASQIGAARFFTNGVDSTTTGQDLVAAYRWIPEQNVGTFNFSLAVSHNETHLRAVRSTPQLSALTPAPPFLTQYRIKTLTKGQPKYKGSFVTDWTGGRFGVTAKATYYGDTLQSSSTNNAAGDYLLKAKTLVDLEGRMNLIAGMQVAVGAENLFDTYPTTPPYVLNGVTNSSNGVGQFGNYSPFGFQGRYVYARVSYSW
jgi:iron complex outermembrane receptor protein